MQKAGLGPLAREQLTAEQLETVIYDIQYDPRKASMPVETASSAQRMWRCLSRVDNGRRTSLDPKRDSLACLPQVDEGCLFVCMEAETWDGHDFTECVRPLFPSPIAGDDVLCPRSITVCVYPAPSHDATTCSPLLPAVSGEWGGGICGDAAAGAWGRVPAARGLPSARRGQHAGGAGQAVRRLLRQVSARWPSPAVARLPAVVGFSWCHFCHVKNCRHIDHSLLTETCKLKSFCTAFCVQVFTLLL